MTVTDFDSEQTFRLEGIRDQTIDFGGIPHYRMTAIDPALTAAQNRARSMVVLTDCHNVTLDNLTILGPKPYGTGYVAAFEAQHGIELHHCTNITIRNYICQCMYGDGLYNHDSDDIEMSLFNTGWTGRQGTSIVEGQRINIHHGTYTQVSRSVLDLEPNNAAQVVSDVHFHDITVQYHRLGFVSSVGGGTVQNVTVENIEGIGTNLGSPIQANIGGIRRNFTFRDLTADQGNSNPYGSAFSFGRVHGVNFERVNQPLKAGRTPPMKIARFWDCTGLLVVDGEIQANEAAGTLSPWNWSAS